MQPFFNGSLAGASGINTFELKYDYYEIKLLAVLNKAQHSYNRKQAIRNSTNYAQFRYNRIQAME